MVRVLKNRSLPSILASLGFTDRFLYKYFELGSKRPNLIPIYDLIDVSNPIEVVRLNPEETLGILIQGPINKKVTFSFCNFVRTIYPDVKLVLSTWESEDTSLFDSLIGENFFVVKSKVPSYPGPSNLNLQITSTKAGIEVLESKGCNYILKTRTDIFLTNPQFLNYLTWLKDKGEPDSIVFSSFNSFLFRYFSLTDQVMFGSVENLSRFWSVDLMGLHDSVEIPEIFLFKKYIEFHGFQIEDTLNSYLTALSRFSVIADHEQLGQVWNKGVYTSLMFRWRGNRFPHPMSPLSSWLWEMINSDRTYIEKLESKLI